MSETLSIIVTCHNKECLIDQVVRSILENTKSQFQLVMVFDGCTDGSEIKVEQVLGKNSSRNLADVRVFHTPDVFETKANNYGMKRADGDTLILVQDDMVICEKGWERRLTHPLATYPNVLSVSARGAHNVTLRRKPALFRYAELDCPDAATRERGLSRDTFAIRDTANRGPLALDAEKVRVLRYLDERFAPYIWDEHDLNLRAYRDYRWIAGCYWIDCLSKPEWGTTRKKNQELFQRTYRRNMNILYRRHRKLITGEKHNEDRSLVFQHGVAEQCG